MIDFGHIVIIIKSERFDNTAIKQIAMFAIIGIGRYAFGGYAIIGQRYE